MSLSTLLPTAFPAIWLLPKMVRQPAGHFYTLGPLLPLLQIKENHCLQRLLANLAE